MTVAPRSASRRVAMGSETACSQASTVTPASGRNGSDMAAHPAGSAGEGGDIAVRVEHAQLDLYAAAVGLGRRLDHRALDRDEGALVDRPPKPAGELTAGQPIHAELLVHQPAHVAEHSDAGHKAALVAHLPRLLIIVDAAPGGGGAILGQDAQGGQRRVGDDWWLHYLPRSRGSSWSRRASPSRLKARTSTKMERPGKIDS